MAGMETCLVNLLGPGDRIVVCVNGFFGQRLIDVAGRTGAQVTVTFSMPAMPEMGMAAMKTVIKATESSGGMYEGKGDLGSGGTWQVSVTARRDGKIIANKRLTVKATGGM